MRVFLRDKDKFICEYLEENIWFLIRVRVLIYSFFGLKFYMMGSIINYVDDRYDL